MFIGFVIGSDRAINNIIKIKRGTYGGFIDMPGTSSGCREDRKEDQSVERLHLDLNWNLTDRKIQIIKFVTDDIEYLLGSGYKIIAMEKICAPAAPENLLTETFDTT